jgi:hypothetical protein
VLDEDAPSQCAWRGDLSTPAHRRTCTGPSQVKRGRVAFGTSMGALSLDVKRERDHPLPSWR